MKFLGEVRPLRRLYSTFAGGWPGIGLIFMRLVVGFVLVSCAGSPSGIKLNHRCFERGVRTLIRVGGGAAEQLGLKRTTLQTKLRKLIISRAGYAS